MSGKGDTQRPELIPNAYADGWARIFGKTEHPSGTPPQEHTQDEERSDGE